MGSIEKIQSEIVKEFEMFDNWVEKYEYIIELGKDLPEINPIHKTEENLIKGCQSRVWLYAEEKDNIICYSADSDAIITKGIVALLIRVLSKQTAKAIIKSDLTFIDKIGFKEQLSQTRANGLVSMVKAMKVYALAFNK